MKLTKKMIDEAATLKQAYEKAHKDANTAKKAYELKVKPILEYIEDELKLAPKKSVEIKGAHKLMEFGPKRAKRVIKEPVEALRRLEAVEQGLGFSHISIPLKVLDEQLRASEVEDLVTLKYESRSVKVTDLD